MTSGRGNDQGQNNWAHLRLGMHYLATDDPSKAIVCLQSVLRTDANNLNAWESLADAYFNRGSYTSALKAYDKVLQLHKAWTSLFLDRIVYQFAKTLIKIHFEMSISKGLKR